MTNGAVYTRVDTLPLVRNTENRVKYFTARVQHAENLVKHTAAHVKHTETLVKHTASRV